MSRLVLRALVMLPLLLIASPAAAQESVEPSTSTLWPAPESVADHEVEVEAFRAHRQETLRLPESWLSLVGLHWLRTGVNTVGSGDDVDLALPETAPEFVGELSLSEDEDGRTVVFTPADGLAVRVDGEPATGPLALRSDAEGEPSQVEVGSVVFHTIERRGKTAIRVKDRQARALREFVGLDFFPVDWRWRVEGRYVPYEDGTSIEVPSVLGGSDPAVIPGAVEFEVAGETYRLDALPGGEDTLFLIFGDATNGGTTYGGGRFLYIQAPPAANRAARVVIDFNKAYSPPCVFSPWATCPLPPRQNRLDVAIEAGEKTYRGWTESSH